MAAENLADSQVTLDVVPNASKFGTKLRAQLTPQMKSLGKDLGKSLSDGVKDGFSKTSIERAVRDAAGVAVARAEALGSQAGSRYGSAMRVEIMRRLKNMPTAKVKAELDDATFNTSVDRAKAKANDLGASRPSIHVDADTARAQADLAATDREASRLDGRRVGINVSSNSGSVLRELRTVGIALAALTSPVTIPLAISGAGILAAGGAAVGAGIGGAALASLPGLKRITAAMQAQKAAQDQVSSSAKNAGSAIQSQAVKTDQARIKALQMAGAQDQLRAAQQQAAQAHRQALQQVQQAEQSLADAQRNAKQAQDALNAARVQARRDAQDLANSVIDAELNERSAVLSLAEAQQTLVEQTQKAAQAQQAVQSARQNLATAQSGAATVNANPQSSTAQKAAAASAVAGARAQLAAAQQQAKDEELATKRAKLAVDQAVQGLREQRLELSRLRAEKKASDRDGINGDRNVIAARQQVAAADAEVRRQEQALSDARRNVAISDADSARSVRAAQRAIQEQLLQNKLATDQAKVSATGASAATQKWGKTLAQLTPAEHGLFDAITRFKQRHDAWAKSLENPIFRAYGTWLDAISKHFGLLSPAVRGSANALNRLGQEADKALGGKFWTSFSKLIGKQSYTDTLHLGRAAGNVAKGVGGIIKNFLPYAPGFFKWLDKITGKFANWATGKKGKQDFGSFMDKAKQNWPTVKDILKDLWQITKNLSSALGGMSPSALKGLENILALIGKLSPDQLQALLVVAGGAYVGSKISGGKTGGKTGGFNLGGILGGIGLAPSAITNPYNAGKNAKGGLGHQLGGAAKAIAPGIGSGALIGGGIGGPFGALVGGAIGGAVSETAFGLGTAKNAFRNFGGWWNKTLIPSLKTDLDNSKRLIRTGWNNAWSYVSSRPRVIWNGLSGWFTKSFVPGVRSKFTSAKNWVVTRWREGWNYVSSRPRAIWNGLSGWFTKSFVPGVRNKLTGAKNWVVTRWREGWNYVTSRPRAIWSDLSNWFTKKFIPGLRSAFTRAVHAISVAWGKVASVAKAPINFVIRTVYDRGIKGTWDKVASWLHLPKSWQAPYIKPLAQGGIERFAGGAENHVAQIAKAGEMRLWAEPETGGEAYVPLAPSKRARSTKILQTVADEFGYGLAPKGALGPNVTPFADGGIVRRFANGGLWGWVDKTFGSIASKVTNFGKTALSFLANPADYIKGKVTGAIGKIPGADSPYGAAGKALSTKVLDQVLSFAKRVASVFGTGGAAMKALKLAESREGVPYVYGGTDWQHGMDCSGLTMLSYRKAGIGIPRTSQQQWGFVKHIPLAQAQPGDLLFAEFGGAGPGHVGFRTQYPYNSAKASFNEPHTGAVARYRTMGGWTAAGVVPGAHNGTFRGVPGSTAGGRHAGPGKSRAWARSELPELGWGNQFSALNNINNHESSWRWYAANPSGAYGIPQALPGSKMRSAGADWHDNSFTQLKWQMGYIHNRYGNPNNAWSFWRRHSYYADGGDPPPGTWGTTGENGPELQYFGAPSRVFSHEDSKRLTAAAGGDGASVVNEWHAHFDGASRAELRHLTQTEFYRQSVRQAQVARPGRRR